MACFLVPAAEAVVTTAMTKALQKKEGAETEYKVSFSRKLNWLNNLLWGGSSLLAFEHVWHGEVTPWFPFLTAAANPTSALEMLHEMATAGVTMSVLVTAFWLGMVAVANATEKRARQTQTDTE